MNSTFYEFITYKLTRKLREDADYGIEKLFTEEMAGDIIEQCQRLQKKMEAYLVESGMMDFNKSFEEKGV